MAEREAELLSKEKDDKNYLADADKEGENPKLTVSEVTPSAVVSEDPRTIKPKAGKGKPAAE